MNEKNVAAFENATQGLLQKLNTLDLSPVERMQAKNFVLLFRDSFQSDDVRRATFGPIIGDDYKYMPYASYGFCKAASCSFVYLMNSSNWRLMYINEIWAHGPHYFVQHVPTKTNFDLTFDQYVYDGVQVPYYMGRPIDINPDAKRVMMRFLNATGIDMQTVINMKQHNGKN